MSEKNLIGPKVRELRMHTGWSQAQLAIKLGERGWHCSAEHVSNIEQGEEPVSDVQFLVLGFVFEVNHAELFPSHLAEEIPRTKKPDLD
jgi:transcriptional regulator with XRE-family HTH domain